MNTIELSKDTVARIKGYPNWEEMENFIIDHNPPVIVAQLLVGAIKEALEHLQSQQEGEAIKILSRLVDLKYHKEQNGETEYYLREKAKAWADAKVLVAENTMNIDFKIEQSASPQPSNEAAPFAYLWQFPDVSQPSKVAEDLQKENERLKSALDFNVKENLNLIKTVSRLSNPSPVAVPQMKWVFMDVNNPTFPEPRDEEYFVEYESGVRGALYYFGETSNTRWKVKVKKWLDESAQS
jgi:hypothetical protein